MAVNLTFAQVYITSAEQGQNEKKKNTTMETTATPLFLARQTKPKYSIRVLRANVSLLE